MPLRWVGLLAEPLRAAALQAQELMDLAGMSAEDQAKVCVRGGGRQEAKVRLVWGLWGEGQRRGEERA